MKRRAFLFGIGLVAGGRIVPWGSTAPAPAKQETVVLEISGMT